MHYQSWNIELLEVLGEVCLGEGLYTFISIQESGLHAPEPELIQRALRHLYTFVGTIKRRREIFVELRSILHDTAPEVVEHVDRQALWIRRGFQHDRRHCGNKDRFRHTLCAVPSD